MKPLGELERIDNTQPTIECGVCKDEAMVAVGTHIHVHAEYEHYAPCPFCLRGLRVELSKSSPWRPDGYWQGRDIPDDLVETYVNSTRPAPPIGPAAQRAELAKLIASVNLKAMEP